MNKQKQKQRKGKFDFFSQTKQNKCPVFYYCSIGRWFSARIQYIYEDREERI